jgi:hypothetical protein
MLSRSAPNDQDELTDIGVEPLLTVLDRSAIVGPAAELRQSFLTLRPGLGWLIRETASQAAVSQVVQLCEPRCNRRNGITLKAVAEQPCR